MRELWRWVKIALVLLLGLFLIARSCPLVAKDTNELVTHLPPDAVSVSEYLHAGQAVHDGKGNEIGDINDVLLDSNGNATVIMIGLGGNVFGGGEKNVAVSFSTLEITDKDLKPYVVLDLPTETLEMAPGFEFDRAKRRWMPAPARLIDGPAPEK